jgi:hypothetical protein
MVQVRHFHTVKLADQKDIYEEVTQKILNYKPGMFKGNAGPLTKALKKAIPSSTARVNFLRKMKVSLDPESDPGQYVQQQLDKILNEEAKTLSSTIIKACKSKKEPNGGEVIHRLPELESFEDRKEVLERAVKEAAKKLKCSEGDIMKKMKRDKILQFLVSNDQGDPNQDLESDQSDEKRSERKEDILSFQVTFETFLREFAVKWRSKADREGIEALLRRMGEVLGKYPERSSNPNFFVDLLMSSLDEHERSFFILLSKAFWSKEMRDWIESIGKLVDGYSGTRPSWPLITYHEDEVLVSSFMDDVGLLVIDAKADADFVAKFEAFKQEEEKTLPSDFRTYLDISLDKVCKAIENSDPDFNEHSFRALILPRTILDSFDDFFKTSERVDGVNLSMSSSHEENREWGKLFNDFSIGRSRENENRFLLVECKALCKTSVGKLLFKESHSRGVQREKILTDLLKLCKMAHRQYMDHTQSSYVENFGILTLQTVGLTYVLFEVSPMNVTYLESNIQECWVMKPLFSGRIRDLDSAKEAFFLGKYISSVVVTDYLKLIPASVGKGPRLKSYKTDPQEIEKKKDKKDKKGGGLTRSGSKSRQAKNTPVIEGKPRTRAREPWDYIRLEEVQEALERQGFTSNCRWNQRKLSFTCSGTLGEMQVFVKLSRKEDLLNSERIIYSLLEDYGDVQRILLPILDLKGCWVFPLLEPVDLTAVREFGVEKLIGDVLIGLNTLWNAGAVHLDLCLDNLLWTGSDYVLTDFGLSLTRGTVITYPRGRSGFMHPELSALESMDGDSGVYAEPYMDMYSFGRLLMGLGFSIGYGYSDFTHAFDLNGAPMGEIDPDAEKFLQLGTFVCFNSHCSIVDVLDKWVSLSSNSKQCVQSIMTNLTSSRNRPRAQAMH